MASFGHVAVGMLTGRLHGGDGNGGGGTEPGAKGTAKRRPCSWATLLLFAGLALLPDADVLLVTLGACDTGACGHRGASHSLPVAIAIGLLSGLIARRLRWPVLRTVLATTVAVGSHALLDVLGAGGRGLPLLWPFSERALHLAGPDLPGRPARARAAVAGRARSTWPSSSRSSCPSWFTRPGRGSRAGCRRAASFVASRRCPASPSSRAASRRRLRSRRAPRRPPRRPPRPHVSDEGDPPLRSAG